MELVVSCFPMPWERLLSFYYVCLTLPYGFRGAMERLQAEGHDIDKMAKAQLRRLQQDLCVVLPSEEVEVSAENKRPVEVKLRSATTRLREVVTFMMSLSLF